MKNPFILLLLLFSLPLAVARLQEPLCISKSCPQNTVCRLVKDCRKGLACKMIAECLDSPPRYSHTGVCEIGDPVLELVNGIWKDTYCYLPQSCPSGAYCNSALQDTYATCCRSFPDRPVEELKCPIVSKPDTHYCGSECNTDGGCPQGRKCCRTGCRKMCLVPQPYDPCDTKFSNVSVNCTKPQDPLCISKGCPQNTACRVVQECRRGARCKMVAKCLENRLQYSDLGTCEIGEPVLLPYSNGTWENTLCGAGKPCPARSFCNMDAINGQATCCRSHPGRPVKQGKCPNVLDPNMSICLNQCGNDGDCRHGLKCCLVGCSRKCLVPDIDDPCDNKTCQPLEYCMRPTMSKCIFRSGCYQEGECAPCYQESFDCQLKCRKGYITDWRGCPQCRCQVVPENKMGKRNNENFVWLFFHLSVCLIFVI